MSKLNFYAVFDKKAETYNAPVVIVNDAVAIRQIIACMRDVDSLFNRFPEDFALVKVAEFDQSTGDILPLSDVVLSTFAGLRDSVPEASPKA